MALGLLGTAVFLAGVVLIAALQWIARKLARPLELPMDVVNGVLHGVGFLIIMPFVFSILLEAHVSALTSRLVPVLKAEFARG